MFRCWAAGEPRAGQIERAPEEMHRADLADEGCATLTHYPVRLNQLPPEHTRGVAVVGGMLDVFGERDGGVHLVGTRDDVRFDPQTVQRRKCLAVKLCNRFGRQWHDALGALAVTYREDMVDEVE